MAAPMPRLTTWDFQHPVSAADAAHLNDQAQPAPAGSAGLPRPGTAYQTIKNPSPACRTKLGNTRGKSEFIYPGRAVVLRPMWHDSGSCAGRSGAIGAI